jgi:general secretion pathway protein H
MVQMVALAAKIMTPISETRNPLTRAAGFTLLELTLVLLILGLASVLVVPNLGGLESRNFNAQVREATSLLNYARRIAVVKGVPGKAIFHIAEDDSELDQVASRSASSGSWVSQGIAVEYRDSTEQLVEVEDLVEILFYPEGGSTGGELTLRQGDRLAVLHIDPFSGRVSTELNAN